MSDILKNTNQLCEILNQKYKSRGYCSDGTEYIFVTLRKYYKIIQSGEHQRSVHAFIDKTTGDILKPASWSSPAKGVRFNVVNDIELLETRADCFGSYLYR